jgi:RNA-binding protein YhbY
MAIGGACSIDYERMLDGAESMAELMEIMTEGLTDSIYVEVQKALRAALDVKVSMKNNTSFVGSWIPEEMVKLVNVVKAYGTGATIFASPEFVAAMGADAIVPVAANGNYGGIYHPQDIDAIHNQGYINIFRGTPVVQFRQSFIDETNSTTWIDPQLAYVMPTGGERVVKVVLEGATQVRDWENKDGSMEIHFYKKMGAAIAAQHNWAIYKNTGVADTFSQVYDI